METKKPKNRLALNTLPTNIPIKKFKEDKNYVSDNSARSAHPAEKTSLIHKLQGRYSTDHQSTERITNPAKRISLGNQVNDEYDNVFSDDVALHLEEQLYRDGYQKDYIRFLLNDEKNYILSRNFLQKTNYTISSRYIVVNLLLKLQQYFKLPDNEYYMAVKLMDYSSQICSDIREGVLLGITSVWLVHKYTDNTITISPKAILKGLKLVPSMNYGYRVEDILRMERRILVATKFKIKLPDPSIFLEHFIRKLRLTAHKHIYYGSYFVCDCLSKFPKFSFLTPSLVAAIALYTTLVVMKEDTSRFLQMTKNVFQEDNLKMHCSDAISSMCYVYKKSELNEPFFKYSVTERLNISDYWAKYIRKMMNFPNNPIS